MESTRSNAGRQASTPRFIAARQRSGTDGSMWYVMGFLPRIREAGLKRVHPNSISRI